MIGIYFSRRMLLALGMIGVIVLAVRTLQAGPQTQSDQSQGQTQEKPKKKGGFFDSVKQNSNSTSNTDTSSGSSQSSGQGSNQNTNQGSSSGNGSGQQQNSNKGGFFQGMKSATGSSSQQASATSSMGTKGLGEGAAMGNVTPTAEDRSIVSQMEGYTVPQGDLSKFIEAGNLKPKQ